MVVQTTPILANQWRWVLFLSQCNWKHVSRPSEQDCVPESRLDCISSKPSWTMANYGISTFACHCIFFFRPLQTKVASVLDKAAAIRKLEATWPKFKLYNYIHLVRYAEMTMAIRWSSINFPQDLKTQGLSPIDAFRTKHHKSSDFWTVFLYLLDCLSVAWKGQRCLNIMSDPIHTAESHVFLFRI